MKLEEFYKNILDMIYMRHREPYEALKTLKCSAIAVHSWTALQNIRDGEISKAEKELELAIVWDNIPIKRDMSIIREKADEVRKNIRRLTPRDLDEEYRLAVTMEYWKQYM